jgi:hypothetical protein
MKRDTHTRTTDNDTSGATGALTGHSGSATTNANPGNYPFQNFGDTTHAGVSEQQDLHLQQDALTSNRTVDN